MVPLDQFDSVELIEQATPGLRLLGTESGGVADPVLLLAFSLSSKDNETSGHCERLSCRALVLGRALQLSPDEISALRLGGIVHDVGKLFIPDDILRKAGPLDAGERAIINEHPALGERLCKPIRMLAPALPIIRHHHERFDGSGYPDHLFGEQVPLIARIVQIVDIFDALTTARPYKPAWTLEQSLRTMKAEASRGWIDGRLFREFSSLMTKCR